MGRNMNHKQIEQHHKSGCILVHRASQKLGCDHLEVFRLACSFNNTNGYGDYHEKYAVYGLVPDFIQDFCLDVLVDRIKPQNPKGKKQDDGQKFLPESGVD